MDEKPKAMLVNVGGATAPAIHTLNEQKPDFICFFVSADSKHSIRDSILPSLTYQPEHYDWIETPAPQSLLECYRVLTRELPNLLKKWEVDPQDLAVEYTAGTKPMSVAAVLATIEFSSQYFYVGSRDPSGRDREGIGVVLDGKEFSWFQTNPWEELAVRDRKEIALLFNHGRYADARERAMRLARVVPEEMRKIYEALADLIEGYALWDRFEFREAQVKISKSCAVLKTYLAGRDDPLRMTIEQVEAQLPFLRGLCERSKAAQRLDALDMLANAERRAVKAQKYDDAVARLYAVLEGLARNRLASKYDIKTNCVRPDQVPERLRERYKCLYQDPDKPEDGLRLGLQASYHLLAELKDELGMKYLQYENELNRVLNARNQSRLAHGTEPVKSETYHKLREIIMVFAEAKEEDLPIFPEMRL